MPAGSEAADAPLSDWLVDSLSAMRLLTAINAHFKASLRVTALLEADATAASVAEMLDGAAGEVKFTGLTQTLVQL